MKVDDKRNEIELALLDSIKESKGGFRKDAIEHYASFAHSILELKQSEIKNEN